MKPDKRLALRRNLMSDLTPDDLAGVAGANSGVSCVPDCPTIEVACPSNPVTNCTVVHVTRQATCIC